MKAVMKLFIPIVFIVIISGCSNNEDKFRVIFFSDIPASYSEDITSVIKEALSVRDEEFDLSMFPVTYEKLVVEIAGHNGDIFFLKEELMSAAYEPEGLVPLDDAVPDDVLKSIGDYIDVDSVTSETHVYALPIDSSSKLLQGIELDEPLVAIIPIYSENKAFSIELLQYIMDHN